MRMARHSFTMVAVANVLPQPGPPVSTMMGALDDSRIASLCPADSFTSAQPHARERCCLTCVPCRAHETRRAHATAGKDDHA